MLTKMLGTKPFVWWFGKILEKYFFGGGVFVFCFQKRGSVAKLLFLMALSVVVFLVVNKRFVTSEEILASSTRV